MLPEEEGWVWAGAQVGLYHEYQSQGEEPHQGQKKQTLAKWSKGELIGRLSRDHRTAEI